MTRAALGRNEMMRQFAHLLIRFYQLSFSALIGRHCRYEPSCSHYMDEAIQHYGVWAGGWMGVARLCRCHPWGGAGYDPVPLHHTGHWYQPWTYGQWRSNRQCEAVEDDQRGRGDEK